MSIITGRVASVPTVRLPDGHNPYVSDGPARRQGRIHLRAGRGIGAAAARLFAREGARVALEARSEDQLAAVTDEIREAGGQADYVIVDLADGNSVRAGVDRAADKWGRLDVAFNNGATIMPPGPVDQVTEADFDNVDNVNLKGVFLAMAAEIAAIRCHRKIWRHRQHLERAHPRANPQLPAQGNETSGQQPDRVRCGHLRPRGRSASTRDQPRGH